MTSDEVCIAAGQSITDAWRSLLVESRWRAAAAYKDANPFVLHVKWFAVQTFHTVCLDLQTSSSDSIFYQLGSVADWLNNASWVIGALWYFHSSRKFPYSPHRANNSPGVPLEDNQTVRFTEISGWILKMCPEAIGLSERVNVRRLTTQRGTTCLWQQKRNPLRSNTE